MKNFVDNMKSQSLVKLLIADDHQLFLQGIASLLNTETAFVTDTVSNGFDVLTRIEEKEYDVCLLDISMPGLDGIATAKTLKKKGSLVKVIILTSYNDREIITEIMQAGIAGYLLKNCTKQELVLAIQKVMNGGVYFSSDINDIIVSDYTHQLKLSKEKYTDHIVLTRRETEIIRLLAREYTNERIASELNISYRTVETHRKNMMQKTDAHNLAGLLKFAYSEGIIK